MRCAVMLIFVVVLLIGCSSPTEKPVKEKVVVKENVSKVETSLIVPNLELPRQVVFVEKGNINVRSEDEILILYGPHSGNFDVRLDKGKIDVFGTGTGEIILAAKNDRYLFYSRVWVTGLKEGFAIVPVDEALFLKVGEDSSFKFKVIPIGNYSGRVFLKAEVSSSQIEVSLKPNSGKPPFEFEAIIKAKSEIPDGNYLKIVGKSGNLTAESYLLINNPVKKKEEGLFSLFLKILYVVTLPVRLAAGIALGATAGIVTSAALLANPATFFSPSILHAVEAGVISGMEVTKFFVSDPFRGVSVEKGDIVSVGRVAISRNDFKVLLPKVEMQPIIGKTYSVPLLVLGKSQVKLDVKAPGGIDVEVTPKEGKAPFKAELKIKARVEAKKKGLIFKKVVPYVVTINASSGSNFEIYKLYLKPVKKDYDVILSSNLIFVKKNEFATIKAYVLRNNEFVSEETTLKVTTPSGIEVFMDKVSGRAPFEANITFYAKNVKSGVYFAKVGEEVMKIIVSEENAFLDFPKMSVSQGSFAEGRIFVYSLTPVREDLKILTNLNHSLKKVNEYEYILTVFADKYQPPGKYKVTAILGEPYEFEINVMGTPVVTEYEQSIVVERGKSKDIKIVLRSAGYRGEIDLEFSGRGVSVHPEKIKASVPGEVVIRISSNEQSGTVTFSGYVNYGGVRYQISGSIYVSVR